MEKPSEHELNRAVASLFAEARVESGATQAQMAKALNTSPNQIHRLENGLQWVNLLHLEKLAHYVGAQPADLLSGFKVEIAERPAQTAPAAKWSPLAASVAEAIEAGNFPEALHLLAAAMRAAAK